MPKIYESNNYILLCTDYADPAQHHHMAAHIILALKDNMTVLSDNRQIDCRGIMIPSGFSHRIDTHQCPVLVLLFDSTTDAAHRIQALQILAESDCSTLCQLYSDYERTDSPDAYRNFERQVLMLVGLETAGCRVTDDRILTAMNMVRSELSGSPSCRNIADSVCLSQSRFSHLFRQQTGMTFAAYRIYARLMHAYSRMLSGVSITEAALEAGFSGSSHFADVNRRVFGLNASNIIKNSTFTRIQ